LIRSRLVPFAFLLSGVSGLIYEVLWSRYLSLFVGHSAYAQVLVLAVYLGGMAVGALAVARFSERAEHPLRWYAAAELALGVLGVAFHPIFQGVTGASYDLIFPALGSAPLVGSARWAIAGLLILPQAMVLGATFPLMAAGLVRIDSGHPGRGVARAYFLNTAGGALGVLLAGFWLIGLLGLPGTSLAAAGVNFAVAALVWYATRDALEGTGGARTRTREASDAEATVAGGGAASPSWSPNPRSLFVVLMTVSFGTALASFAYEIGWIRMLSLVLGSATHSFELMLSAFILGIALGAAAVRQAADRTGDPLRLLGLIQVGMGLTALLSLPVYLGSFDVSATLIQSLTGKPGGYTLFNLARYGLCLAIMLPSTVLAGATFPVIAGTLIRAGSGERAIGQVYGVNTIGAVAGAGLAGLLGLPFFGLKGLIMVGALIDVLLGLWLLERSVRWTTTKPRTALAVAAACAVTFAAVGGLVSFDPLTMSSGVFRTGRMPEPESRVSMYYQDGRTATVSAHMSVEDRVVILSTNGKPDASLGGRWLHDRRDTLPEVPVPPGRDYTTQVVAPIVTLAHRPGARSIANIGHGSGMTASALLTSSDLERLVTIEIEPFMVEGSLVFLPINAAAFADPRSSFVFDDAKSFFSYQQERYDIIFAEPSNPWVSGISSLFTREFYAQAAGFLAEDGVLGQWIHTYELSDELLMSVVSALDAVFPYYRAYMAGDGDIAIVAGMEPLTEPDWTVVQSPAFQELTRSIPRFQTQHMEALLLFDEGTFRLLLDAGEPPNSDFRPILDIGAERSRFDKLTAEGINSFAVSRIDLARYLSGRTMERLPYATVPAEGLLPSMLRERGAWLREAVETGGGISPEEFPSWQAELVNLQRLLELSDLSPLLDSWEAWSRAFVRAENALHWGTWDWVDSTLYATADSFMDRHAAPPEARASVDLMRAYSLGDFATAASAANLLVEPVADNGPWMPVRLLLDLAVIANLEVGQPEEARRAVDLLVPRTGRAEWNVRNRLLDALVAQAELEGA